MKYRLLFFLSIFIFAFLSSLTVGILVYSQRSNTRGEPVCSIEIESSGRRTAFLDCINGGTINSSQQCTPTTPILQKAQLIETFPEGRRNCRFVPRNACVSNTNASYGWVCEDEKDPFTETKVKSIVCPFPARNTVLIQQVISPVDMPFGIYCEWDDSKGGGGGCLSGLTTSGEKFEEIRLTFVILARRIKCFWQIGGVYDYGSCQCGQSPIVIDVLGNGFN